MAVRVEFLPLCVFKLDVCVRKRVVSADRAPQAAGISVQTRTIEVRVMPSVELITAVLRERTYCTHPQLIITATHRSCEIEKLKEKTH